MMMYVFWSLLPLSKTSCFHCCFVNYTNITLPIFTKFGVKEAHGPRKNH